MKTNHSPSQKSPQSLSELDAGDVVVSFNDGAYRVEEIVTLQGVPSYSLRSMEPEHPGRAGPFAVPVDSAPQVLRHLSSLEVAKKAYAKVLAPHPAPARVFGTKDYHKSLTLLRIGMLDTWVDLLVQLRGQRSTFGDEVALFDPLFSLLVHRVGTELALCLEKPYEEITNAMLSDIGFSAPLPKTRKSSTLERNAYIYVVSQMARTGREKLSKAQQAILATGIFEGRVQQEGLYLCLLSMDDAGVEAAIEGYELVGATAHRDILREAATRIQRQGDTVFTELDARLFELGFEIPARKDFIEEHPQEFGPLAAQ